ncbi:hypothetical protein OH492_19040 [Vibrio chagasii]|nr:hypothetical protein [Vibrio chagasii]
MAITNKTHTQIQQRPLPYPIGITNPEGNGFASNINGKDEISAIEAELLHEPGETKPVFSSCGRSV